MKKINPAKEDYQRLRGLTCDQLWTQEVPAFDGGDSRERMARVGVLRAVGVVFSEFGTMAQKEMARQWLRGLLRDPEEKVRRYAMTALPKIGASEQDESALLALIKTPATEREKTSLSRTLEKIGGTASLAAVQDLAPASLQKIVANVARLEDPGTVDLKRNFAEFSGVRIHLQCRRGLEGILKEEAGSVFQREGKFCILECRPGVVVVEARKAFCLGDIFILRCFHTLSFFLAAGLRSPGQESSLPAAVAGVIASPMARRILEAFTEGPIRYRLEFASKGHQRAAVREVAERVHALCPIFLNDPRNALWQINVLPDGGGVEMTPRLRPDPRFSYRRRDVPAASHPPLAASMARLAVPAVNDTIWDPFCGSGLELIECALLGGVRKIIGSDRSAEATAIARENFFSACSRRSAPSDLRDASFHTADFRATEAIIGRGGISLLITNPPMGRRVPIPDLPGLVADLFQVAADGLAPGGRLVFANPCPETPVPRSLQRVYGQKIDLGGFDVQLEKYLKTG
jgi:SAM-dependent methyltransferase